MPVKFIAEVSSNHNNSIKRCRDFIKASADVGCTGVKFQLFKISELFSPEILGNSEEHRKRKAWELPPGFIPELADYTHELNMEFSCTPFYLDAVDILEPYVDFYKIASYELLWHELFRKCASTGKPLVFSTGMAVQTEIEDALNSIVGYKTSDITILHCSSAYPTPVDEANLEAINTLRKILKPFEGKFNIDYGWSDHTVSPAVLLRSLFTYNASFIEFHLDLDGKGEEFSKGHCWLPGQIEAVIKMYRDGLLSDGTGIVAPRASELPDREWRADPSDGLRPLLNKRKEWLNK